ncbi:MAG: sulfatase [Balneolales bacterium]
MQRKRTRFGSILLGTGLLFILPALSAPVAAQDAGESPNIVIVFTDDMGYGDLGTYGHPTIRTPALDGMAEEGMKFTQFYVPSPVCTPSRAALLTGRLPVRSGVNGVLWPYSDRGLPPGEVTMASALKTRAYATAHIGKWHLGDHSPHLPTDHGFDYYYGIPYSNDMNREQWGLIHTPLMRNEEIIEQPVDQRTLTRRYTDESLRFIRKNKNRPFFLYLAHTFPHTPLFASEEFEGRSSRGLYGDVVEEIDSGMKQILDELKAHGLEENTLVIFTSDNGPWLLRGQDGGSAGLLSGGKHTTWEGGTRVPAIARWPGTIGEGQVSQALASTMDLYTTVIKLAGAELPGDRIIDGVDLMPVLTGREDQVRDIIHYYGNG